jgi:hypothetical protein
VSAALGPTAPVDIIKWASLDLKFSLIIITRWVVGPFTETFLFRPRETIVIIKTKKLLALYRDRDRARPGLQFFNFVGGRGNVV